MGLSFPQLAGKIRTEADAYKFLEDLRWGDEAICPHCGSVDKHYFLNPANGSSRKTRTGAASHRRVWKCKACRKQFSVLTGTIFHGSKIPVRTWVFVVFEMASSKNGVSAREIERKYGLTPKTAWFMLHRIREAMKREPMAGLLSGRVVADETFFGGKPSNRHGHDGRKRMQGQSDKTPILALVSRETGEVRSRVMPHA
jgi:transposase-like protein